MSRQYTERERQYTEREISAVKSGVTVVFSGMSALMTLGGAAAISLGHVVLPAIGLQSLVAGGGSLSTAAISFLAGGGVSLIPAIALYILINQTVKNPALSMPLQFLVFVGYIASSYLVGAALFNISSNSLFLQAFAGSLTIPATLFGAVLAIMLLALLTTLLCKGCDKGCTALSKAKAGLFAAPAPRWYGDGDNTPIATAFAVPDN